MPPPAPADARDAPASPPPGPLHPAQRRLLAEELVRLRRADEARRWVASQRAGRIDPNPHQIDAVVFALQKVREGGCILADEVGLGKTIEAGLVIAQLRAEGATRVLLIVPKPLLGQWRQELYALFGIAAREARAEPGDLDADGVYIVGREAAGQKVMAGLLAQQAWDLCVIDEAHEMFAGVWRRYDAGGRYQADSPHAKIAGRVKEALGPTPMLLLTATPIQNSLAELWGLVQFVDPTGTLLGDLPTFRAVFTAQGDRRLAPGAAHELQRRMGQVVQRTLRRQAQAFMRRPFVDRRARTFEYAMQPEEKALYDDVTRYLLRPHLQAFRGSHRSLLLLGFHRRMASSKAALAASLANVETRLERMLRAAEGGRLDEGEETARVFVDDLDDDEIVEALEAEERDEGGDLQAEAIGEELAHVRALKERAEGLATDSKAQALMQAVRVVLRRGERGEGSGKVVIFTESLTTQSYLRALLVQGGVAREDEITLFRGQNVGPRAQEALEAWEREVEAHLPARERPSRQVAVRLALVHEFREKTKVFIGTEAAAKGLNLQFCDTIVNYDLPWNPQRIEQRIGRCHRYGQTRDVTVINFLAKDNAAQQLTYEILSRKLELFGTVLGASDEVLHAAGEAPSDALLGALSADFEAQLNRIYRQARSVEEIEAKLGELREATDERRRHFEEEHERTRSLIETRLDATVRKVFERIREALPAELAAFDAQLERLLVAYLEALGVGFEVEREEAEAGQVRRRFALGASAALPEGLEAGLEVSVGPPAQDEEEEALADPLHLGHPLVLAAVEEARAATAAPRAVRVAGGGAVRGRLRVLKLRFDGLEPVERIAAVGARVEGEGLTPLAAEEAAALLERVRRGPLEEAEGLEVPEDGLLFEDLAAEALFDAQAEVEDVEQARFEEAVERLERYVDDRVLVLRRERGELEAQLADAERARDAALGSARRTKAEAAVKRYGERLEALDARLDALRDREDGTYQAQKERVHARRYAPPR
ncbi:MAG TPA: SNF2-related protein, partial [Polyangiaceae bacterium LLY-WYZ-15_(1-7)]|nr:SNF2-related protein [Polyangiaceae bacterium LLY-WYZ-15_(1-7)]